MTTSLEGSPTKAKEAPNSILDLILDLILDSNT